MAKQIVELKERLNILTLILDDARKRYKDRIAELEQKLKEADTAIGVLCTDNDKGKVRKPMSSYRKFY